MAVVTKKFYFSNTTKIIFYDFYSSEVTTNSSEDVEGTLGGSNNNISEIGTEEQRIFERTLRRSRIAFKSKHDILKAVTGKMMLMSTHPNAFGATGNLFVEF